MLKSNWRAGRRRHGPGGMWGPEGEVKAKVEGEGRTTQMDQPTEMVVSPPSSSHLEEPSMYPRLHGTPLQRVTEPAREEALPRVLTRPGS